MLKLTNTLTGNLEPFSPDNGNTVRMYTCGPTVYDFAHIGNLRTFVFEDILRRHLRPATDYIPEMIDLVGRLIQSGYAYPEGESIYYRISRFPSYGRLSRLDKRELKLGARIDVDEYEKEEPRDFVLWKAPKHEKEPRWEAPFGTGRPGWHIECSAMAMKQLGETLDIHCGGVDNIFPHHENEIAQSEAVTGKPFARFWIHGEHLLVEGEKMAKSKGNFYTLRDLIDRGYDPLAIRYLLVSVPYRKQLNFTFEGLDAARSSLDRIKEFLFRLKSSKFKPGRNPAIWGVLTTARKQLDAALDDDLNTAQALAAVFGLIKEGNIALTDDALEEENRSEILQWFEVVEQRLGIVPTVEALVQVDEKVDSLIAQRNEARRNRDFAKADRIRQQLLDLDVIIEDTREGTKWRRK